MAFRTKPDFSAVWASLGDSAKPVDSYITNGWETVKPPRQYFNWIDNRQDSAIAYLYQSGIPEWDARTDYEGGSGVNSYAQGSNGKIYRCLADNGPNIASIGAKDPTNALNSAFWTEAFGTKAAVDDLAATVSTHTTQIGNGSGVTNAPAWRTALSVYSKGEADSLFPPGMINAFGGAVAPSGWRFCNGAAVGRTDPTYKALFDAIGIAYGPGDGSTTFNLPDFRGEFLRGFDAGRGVDSGRTLGSFQADELKSHQHNLSLDTAAGVFDYNGAEGARYKLSGTPESGSGTLLTGGAETRPRNVSVNYIIKL